MKGRLTIISVTGAVSSKELTAPPSLEDLRDGVGGDIEHVPYFTRYQGQRCAAFCHEQGKLDGLPLNERATALWYTQMNGGYRDDYLVGPIVIVSGDAELMREL